MIRPQLQGGHYPPSQPYPMQTTQPPAKQRGHCPPRSPYEVTRSYLGKAEEMLREASEHARKEAPAGEQMNAVKIVSLALAARRLRSELEGGA